MGEVKALLLARGSGHANYLDMAGLSAYDYSTGLSNSIMMNTEAELDTLFHSIVTAINDTLCPNTTYGAVNSNLGGGSITGVDATGKTWTITADTKILDEANASVGSDGELPPHELFSRIGCDRYTKVSLADGSTVYVYNEEDPSDESTCYTIEDTVINPDIIDEKSLIPYKNRQERSIILWAPIWSVSGIRKITCSILPIRHHVPLPIFTSNGSARLEPSVLSTVRLLTVCRGQQIPSTTTGRW